MCGLAPRPMDDLCHQWPRDSLLFGSGAGLGEALRGLGRGVNAAANSDADATVEFAVLAVRALSDSKSLVDDALAGVYTINVNATASIMRTAAATPGDFADWVVSGGGGHVPEPAAESAGSLLRTAHHPLPLLGFGNASFEERGVFHRWTDKAKVLVSGYSALALSIICAESDVDWCLFCWEMLEVDVRRMHSRVLRNIDARLADAPPPSAVLFVLTDVSVDIGAVPGLQLLAGVRRMATSPGHGRCRGLPGLQLLAGVRRMATSPGHRSLRGFGGNHLVRHLHAAVPPQTFAVGQGP